MYDRNLAQATVGNALTAAQPQSLTERLRNEKQHLESRLDEINNVIESLEKNPETQSVLDAVARLGHLGY